MILLVICGAIVFFIISWFVSTSNNVNRLQLKIDEARSGIEIQLRKRYDTLTQSMNIAKGYAAHEKELFTELRRVNSGMSVSEINECARNQQQCMTRFAALGEAYPELKSSEMFSNLQKQLSEENAQFAASKRAFNANTTFYNNLVVSFPSSLVCTIKGVTKLEYIKEDIDDSVRNIDLSWKE